MAKQSSGKTLLVVGAIGAGLWFLLGGSAQAATGPALGPAAQGYLTQITNAQSQLLNGSLSQAAYTAQAVAFLLNATTDPKVSTAELNYLHGVAGV